MSDQVQARGVTTNPGGEAVVPRAVIGAIESDGRRAGRKRESGDVLIGAVLMVPLMVLERE